MMELSSIVALLLFASLASAQSNGSYPVVSSLASLPTITWIDATTLKFVFPDGQTDKTHLRPADPVGDLLDRVPCLFEGVLEGEHSSSIAVSGCQADDVVDVVVYTQHLPGQSMFKIKNRTTQQVEIISDNKINDLEQPRRIRKRSVLLDDDEDYDYDDIGLDNGEAIPEPLPFYVFDVRLAFEENFQRRAGTEIQARQMIARIFTFGKVHLKHSSLGTSIRMKAQGPILKIPNEFWKPGGKKAKDLKASKKYKLQYDDHVPITFFCGNNDGLNIRVRGSSYKRKACDKEKGVSLVAFDDDIQAMAQTWGHETGHWMGFMHDLRVDNRDGTRCEGTGPMSNASRSGGRPSKWSKCSKERLKTWLSKPQNNCIRKDEELFQLKYSFNCLHWKADLQSEGCNRPVDVLHGKWFCSDDGVSCGLICNVGYKISHPSHKTIARCFKNAWIDNLEDFSCVCDTDFKPPYGSLSCQGNTCDLVCDSGYDSCALRTPTSLRCDDNTWNLELSTIACDRQCHRPMFAPNLGSWQFHKTGCGVHLTCPQGYYPSNVKQTVYKENQNSWTIPLESFSCRKDTTEMLVIAGGISSGSRNGRGNGSVQYLQPGEPWKSFPSLPGNWKGFTLDNVGGVLTACGGYLGKNGFFNSPAPACQQLIGRSWVEVSPVPLVPRQGHISWVTPEGLFLLGGYRRDSGPWTTTELVVSTGDQEPGMRFDLVRSSFESCAIEEEDTLVVTGGGKGGTDFVTRYSLDGTAVELPTLNDARYRHGCEKVEIGGKKALIVAGGWQLDSTEILLGDKWEYVGALPSPRDYLVGASLNKKFILAGGRLNGNVITDEILVFDTDTKTWNKTKPMDEPRAFHGMTTKKFSGRV